MRILYLYLFFYDMEDKTQKRLRDDYPNEDCPRFISDLLEEGEMTPQRYFPERSYSRKKYREDEPLGRNSRGIAFEDKQHEFQLFLKELEIKNLSNKNSDLQEELTRVKDRMLYFERMVVSTERRFDRRLQFEQLQSTTFAIYRLMSKTMCISCSEWLIAQYSKIMRNDKSVEFVGSCKNHCIDVQRMKWPNDCKVCLQRSIYYAISKYSQDFWEKLTDPIRKIVIDDRDRYAFLKTHDHQ